HRRHAARAGVPASGYHQHLARTGHLLLAQPALGARGGHLGGREDLAEVEDALPPEPEFVEGVARPRRSAAVGRLRRPATGARPPQRLDCSPFTVGESRKASVSTTPSSLSSGGTPSAHASVAAMSTTRTLRSCLAGAKGVPQKNTGTKASGSWGAPCWCWVALPHALYGSSTITASGAMSSGYMCMSLRTT